MSDRFDIQARKLRRRYIATVFGIISAGGLALFASEAALGEGRRYRANEARVDWQVLEVSRLIDLARRALEEGGSVYASTLGFDAEALERGRHCRRDEAGRAIVAGQPSIARLYAETEPESLCDLGDAFFEAAAAHAAEPTPRRFDRLERSGSRARALLAEVGVEYRRLAEAADRRRIWVTRVTLVALMAMIGLQAVFVFARGLSALARQHERLRMAREAEERLNHDLGAAIRAESEARRAAETADRVKTEFLARLSHEVRTPLNAIEGGGALLLERGDARARPIAAAISSAGRRLGRLFDDMIELARFAAGDVALETERFALSEAIGAAIAEPRIAAAEKKLAFSVEIAPEVEGDYMGDARRLTRAVNALVENAVRFTPRGEVAVSVSPWSDAGIRVEVVDTGPGVPPALRALVFERFAQLDASATRAHGGLGRGLALARSSAQAMGGDIGLSEAPDGGARFWLQAPLLRLSGRGERHGACVATG